MLAQNDYFQYLVKRLLLSEIFEYFEITILVSENISVTVFQDERDIKPICICL
jgi:hypothetical protein